MRTLGARSVRRAHARTLHELTVKVDSILGTAVSGVVVQQTETRGPGRLHHTPEGPPSPFRAGYRIPLGVIPRSVFVERKVEPFQTHSGARIYRVVGIGSNESHRERVSREHVRMWVRNGAERSQRRTRSGAKEDGSTAEDHQPTHIKGIRCTYPPAPAPSRLRNVSTYFAHEWFTNLSRW
jgi:hypothetical protein